MGIITFLFILIYFFCLVILHICLYYLFSYSVLFKSVELYFVNQYTF